MILKSLADRRAFNLAAQQDGRTVNSTRTNHCLLRLNQGPVSQDDANRMCALHRHTINQGVAKNTNMTAFTGPFQINI